MKQNNQKQQQGSTDPFSRIDYRKMVSWPKRIQRESPFLTNVLNQAPIRAVLDLGCGTGEHSRFIGEMGFRVVGVDRSKTMLNQACDSPVPDNVTFIHSDILRLNESVEGQFGAAISLGNTLVSITREKEIQNTFTQIAGKLVSQGVFLFQILNYERIRDQKIRSLPLNFVSEDGNRETIFLRIMNYHEDGMVDFCPTTLSYDPSRDPPLQVKQSRLIQLRGWTCSELLPILENSGFVISALYGDMRQGIYDASGSQDFVVVAKKL